jgi:Bacterial protein of unknown function (DUF839)
MRLMRIPRKVKLGALLGLGSAVAAVTAFAAPSTDDGPNTNTDPYMRPAANGVKITSLLTVSDDGRASSGTTPLARELAGIPDGLGAYKSPKGRDFTLLMNHELRNDPIQGVPRRHGQAGAFVSEWEIDSKTLEVERGNDLVDPGVNYWNYPAGAYQSTPSPAGDNPRVPEDPANPTADDFLAQLAAFGRWCSSSLTGPGQLFNEDSGNGYRGQIYFGNEETNDEGRLFGITTDGRAQQLPRLGMFAWENTLVGLNKGDTTYVMGQEDVASGQPWVYVGEKQSSGNAFDKAGLTNGDSHVIDLLDEAVSNDAQFRAAYGKFNPVPFDLAEIPWDAPGSVQNSQATAEGLTLNRIEDGAFDPRHPRDFYFVTTAGGKNATSARDGGGLWRIRFNDAEDPEAGGTIELLLDGSESPNIWSPDNVDMDRKGHLLIQEDPGNNPHVAQIWAYDVDNGNMGSVARFDPARFEPGGSKFMTQDEESSGIIDASRVMGKGWFLLDAQVHTSAGLDNPAAQVEHGQLMAMKVTKWKKVFD